MNLNAGGLRAKVWDGDVNKWGAYYSQQVPNSTVRYGTGENVAYAKKAGRSYKTPVLVAKFNEKQRDFTQARQLKGISRSVY